jgi:putative addiction module component (TIGR02574 family)
MSALMLSLGVDRLTPQEQLCLVAEILDSLAECPDPPITNAQRRELDRRLANLDAGDTTVSPWPEVEARILGRLQE